jgi:hypothetical protein
MGENGAFSEKDEDFSRIFGSNLGKEYREAIGEFATTLASRR